MKSTRLIKAHFSLAVIFSLLLWDKDDKTTAIAKTTQQRLIAVPATWVADTERSLLVGLI